MNENGKELNDSELEKVTGGSQGSGKTTHVYKTHCPNAKCGRTDYAGPFEGEEVPVQWRCQYCLGVFDWSEYNPQKLS